MFALNQGCSIYKIKDNTKKKVQMCCKLPAMLFDVQLDSNC